MSYQFPPSSPVIHDHEPHGLTLGKSNDLVRGRFDYPTPNPSSSVGRSSSPARATENASQTGITIKKANINRDFNILNPDKEVTRIPLSNTLSSIIIGRSSKSCDYHLRNNDKQVSRSHIRVDHNDSNMTITCLGYNGFGMILPRVCEVSRPNDSDAFFVLKETTKPLKLNKLSKTIRLDHQHTEFHVSRGESVQLPLFTNVLIQIANNVVLLNPDDYEEDLTDDELPQLVKSREESNAATESAAESVHNTEKAKTIPFTPKGPVSTMPQTPHKQHHMITAEEPTPTIKKSNFSIFKDETSEPKGTSEPKQETSEQKQETTQVKLEKEEPIPLAEKNINTPTPAKKRAASEEPMGNKKVKKEPARDADGKLIIDPNCIKHLSNLTEISNILVNHLALSRLSSTPASFLNTILAVVAKLTLEELRAVLHQVDCIGVIYRPGKDAAGKPLEEEYYYVPEKDSDVERTKLVSSVKGYGGLRSCRRTHKQYYWKKPAPIKKSN